MNTVNFDDQIDSINNHSDVYGDFEFYGDDLHDFVSELAEHLMGETNLEYEIGSATDGAVTLAVEGETYTYTSAQQMDDDFEAGKFFDLASLSVEIVVTAQMRNADGFNVGQDNDDENFERYVSMVQDEMNETESYSVSIEFHSWKNGYETITLEYLGNEVDCLPGLPSVGDDFRRASQVVFESSDWFEEEHEAEEA